MSDYVVSELELSGGLLGIGPMPGRLNVYEADLNVILRWGAGLVLTMTTAEELERSGATAIGDDLAAVGVAWRHLAIPDFGAPPPAVREVWPEVSEEAQRILKQGGRVFSHCYGGCGRSGTALLRLMVEAGEDVDLALERLRVVRPCAVETDAQLSWAAEPMYQRLASGEHG